MWSAANIISAMRLGAAPILLGLAWYGHVDAFVVGLVVSFLSDVIDGWLARSRHQTSELGAKLDSWGDLAMYTTLALGTWWLRPELIRREAPFVIVALVSYVLPTSVGLLKFRQLTSYHTWGDKLASVVIGGGVLLLLVWENATLFRVAVVVLAVAEVEEIGITLVLKELRTNVPSIVHAWRGR